VVHEAVAQYFQQAPKTDVDPDEVVALGAAIHASSLVGGVDESDAFLLDVTPLSLRIGVAGGLAETVIERNTPVPIEQTRTFTTYQDNQESVQIKVFQGESRQAEENELLGQFEFAGFNKARRGEVGIDVTFEINSDGLVNVTATDQETGQQSATTITLSSGLSDEELDHILEASPADRVESGPRDDEAGKELALPEAAEAAATAVPTGPEDELEISAPSDFGEELELAAPGEGFEAPASQMGALGDPDSGEDPNEATGPDATASDSEARIPEGDEDIADLALDEELFDAAGVDLADLGHEED
jgi:molecular chaperone DnaK (HSP70)